MEYSAGRPAWRRYGVAILVVALAAAINVALQHTDVPGRVGPFYAAVAIAAWYGGLRPALLAVALSLVGIVVVLDAPAPLSSSSGVDVNRLITFAIVSTLIVMLSASRDRTDAALRASERRFRTLLETANEGVWLLDPAGNTRFANDRMAALLAVTPADLAATTMFDYVYPEDGDAMRQRLRATLAGEAAVFDFRLRRRDGGEVMVLASASPVQDGDGKIVGALGLYTDVTARRRTEADLAKANERFALAAEAVQSLIYEWDVLSNRVVRSAGLMPLLGFHPDEVPDTRSWWHERIHPDDRARVASISARTGPIGDRFANEYRIRHRDGRWITVLDQGRVMYDDAGEITRVVGSTIDITARTSAEDALRLLDASGRELAASLDYEETLQRVAWLAVPALADWCFVDLRTRDGSARRVAVAYADPADANLAAMAMRYPPTPRVPATAWRCMTTGEPMLIERAAASFIDTAKQSAEHQQMLERIAPLSVIVAPLYVAGQVHGAMTLFTTARSGRYYGSDDLGLAVQLGRRSAAAIENARLYQEAREAEARYRGLFEGTRDGILVSDAEGRFIDANPAMSELSGYSREELLTMRVGALRASDPEPGPPEEWQLGPDGARRSEWELRRKDGDTIAVETDLTPIQLASGLVRVAVIRDVSERKRLEQSHLEFIATVAHDLKNPLTAMRGQTQLLRRRLDRGQIPDPARLESALETIDTSAVQMTTLLDELADVMRLRAGEEIELHREPTDLLEIVRRGIATYTRTTERHAIELQTTVDVLVGEWDGPRLERVLANLLANAIKYSPHGGAITVSVDQDRSGPVPVAVLAVSDEGVGIPAADLPLVFARFRRARNVTSIAGTGIGLAGAKRIIDLHGGTINVASTEGCGSTFTVRLPLAFGIELADPDAPVSVPGERHSAEPIIIEP
ncbi:MAG: PAS domain S-box protein [Thermomicrobiales bacterium]